MLTRKKVILPILLFLNAIVLLGQLWPEGAPPFARTVNIVFLILSFLFFAILLLNNKKNDLPK